LLRKEKPTAKPYVAVADAAYPDTSRLALVACGEVEPREPMWDNQISLEATGHRELFLARVLKSPGSSSVEAYVDDEGAIIPSPDRFELSNMILKENKFPLSNGVDILETCCKLQHHNELYQSFVELTAFYKGSGTPRRRQQRSDIPAFVILASNNFSMEEAIHFWNLRASGFFVAWLPFEEIEKKL